VTYNRRFRLGRKGAWWELPLDAKLGLTYSGGTVAAFGAVCSHWCELSVLDAKLRLTRLGRQVDGAELSLVLHARICRLLLMAADLAELS